MTGATHDGGEHGPGGVVSGEAGLAHAGAIVYNQSGYIIVTHVGWFSGSTERKLQKDWVSPAHCASQKN